MPYGRKANPKAEQDAAARLKTELQAKGVKLDAKYWPTYVQAVAYGGYTPTDAANDITSRARGQGGLIHPTFRREQMDWAKPTAAQAPQTSYEEDWAKKLIDSLYPKEEKPPSFEKSGLYSEKDAEALYAKMFDPYYEKQFGAEEEGKRLAAEAMNRAIARLDQDYATGLKQEQTTYNTNTANLLRSLNLALGEHSDAAAAASGGSQLGSGAYLTEQGKARDESAIQQRQLDTALSQYKTNALTQKNRSAFDITDPFKREYENPYGGYQTRLAALKNQKATSRYGFIEDERQRAYQRYLDRYGIK